MNIQPGDMARIVRNGRSESELSPGILDRIVEVMRPAVSGETFVSVDGHISTVDGGSAPMWVVRSKTPLPMKCWQFGMEFVLLFDERPVWDAYLRRLGGVPAEDEVHDEVTA